MLQDIARLYKGSSSERGSDVWESAVNNEAKESGAVINLADIGNRLPEEPLTDRREESQNSKPPTTGQQDKTPAREWPLSAWDYQGRVVSGQGQAKASQPATSNNFIPSKHNPYIKIRQYI